MRFRPITMTTSAALLGGLPLVLSAGDGFELRRPLGISIIGGLLFSQVLTLYTTPAVYLLLDRLRLRGRTTGTSPTVPLARAVSPACRYVRHTLSIATICIPPASGADGMVHRPRRGSWLPIAVLIALAARASAAETCLFSGTTDYGGRLGIAAESTIVAGRTQIECGWS